MNILGIKYPGHDTAAAIVTDGEIICASSQERFDRIKHSKNFPFDSIKWCLSYSGIRVEDVDAVAVQYDFRSALFRYFPKLFLTYGSKALFAFVQNLTDDIRKYFLTIYGIKHSSKLHSKIYFLDHHDCHASSSFYTSPFNTSAIITVDGRGEKDTTRLYEAKKSSLKKIASVAFPHSLGFMYSKITSYLGYKSDCDEGTTMALAAYGDNRFEKSFREMVSFDDGFNFKLLLDKFDYHINMKSDISNNFINEFGNRRLSGCKINTDHMAIARALQKTLEFSLEQLGKKAYSITKSKNLCLSGGVVLNAAANGKLLQSLPFEQIYIHPAAGDDGSVLGAALLLYYKLSKSAYRKTSKWNPYLGFEPTSHDINAAIQNIQYPHFILSKPEIVAARLIAKGYIIGWYQGRSEFGPRALGNRSILAPFWDVKYKNRVNHIKNRESFRPFAPAILEEEMSNIFKFWRVSPYMTSAFPIQREMLQSIPAVTHIDGSARVQTVSYIDNQKFYNLLKEVKKLTGLGMVLNTSLNGPNEPIANEPKDAIKIFENTSMDALFVYNHFVVKNDIVNKLGNIII